MGMKQMKKLYGVSKKQAVDNLTKLTMKKRLAALRQADDHLKRKDAADAKKQAKEMKMSLQDEWDAAHQVTDKHLSRLRKNDEKFASSQTTSQFNGFLSKKNAKIANTLATKALQKREKFLSGFEAWEEERREAKIRAKYAKESHDLLGESNDLRVHKSVKKKSPPVRAHPMKLGDFQALQKKIQDEANKSVLAVRAIALTAGQMQDIK